MGSGSSSPKPPTSKSPAQPKQTPQPKQTKQTASKEPDKKTVTRSKTESINGEDVSGQQYVCVLKGGLVYLNSPSMDDTNEENQRINFNEVVKPEYKSGTWIRVGKTHWLPLEHNGSDVMREYNPDKDEVDFAKARQAKIDAELGAITTSDDGLSFPGRRKSTLDQLEDSALLDDEDDEDSIDSTEQERQREAAEAAAAAKAKREGDAAIMVQAAVRGKQQRKRSEAEIEAIRQKVKEEVMTKAKSRVQELPKRSKSKKRSKKDKKKRSKSKRSSSFNNIDVLS